MIIFLFGRPWAGKTKVGQELAKILNTTFRDGDEWYTEEEKRWIAEGEFTWDESQNFFERLRERLRELRGERMLVLSGQSLFLQEYRQKLKDVFGDNIFLVYLDVPQEVTLNRAALPRTFGEREHFYSAAQYNNEVGEYEDGGIYDLRTENLVSPEQTAQTIVRGIAEHFRKGAT